MSGIRATTLPGRFFRRSYFDKCNMGLAGLELSGQLTGQAAQDCHALIVCSGSASWQEQQDHRDCREKKVPKTRSRVFDRTSELLCSLFLRESSLIRMKSSPSPILIRLTVIILALFNKVRQPANRMQNITNDHFRKAFIPPWKRTGSRYSSASRRVQELPRPSIERCVKPKTDRFPRWWDL